MRDRLLDFVPAFLTDGGFYLILFTLTHVLNASGASSGEVALVFGIYTIAYAVMAPFIGGASDAQGRRRSVLVGSLIFAATAGGLVYTVELTPTDAGLDVGSRIPLLGARGWVYTGMALFALANAFFWPAFQARIGDREPDAEAMGRAIRSFNVGWTLGKGSGFLTAGLLFAKKPEACLPVGCVCGALVFLTLLFGERAPASEHSHEAPPPSSDHPRALKRGFLLAALAANFMVWGAISTLKGLAPKLGDALSLGPIETGALLFSALAAQALGFVVLGRAERWSYRRLNLLLVGPATLGGLLLLYVAGHLPLAIAGALLIGLAQSVTYATSVFYSLDYDERRGLRTGIHEAVLAFGGALPIAGGFLADATGELRASLVLMAALALLATVVVAWLLRTKRQGPSTTGISP